ncbi:sensor histidine kinase [Haloarchaeobius amylolyticus]|uniref:sensor histidine kinase n=1 Tax=Haloarchaeobius amylolyticus TaxID=1198296 RepID=UPI00226E1C5F|nr:HAMP domain-containing sensor histidine kinase [Haloarchaeobius amylolyticus]
MTSDQPDASPPQDRERPGDGSPSAGSSDARVQELQQQVAELQAQAEGTIDGLVLVAGDGTVLRTNDRFFDILDVDTPTSEGTPDGRMLADRLARRIADTDRFRDRVEHLHGHPTEESRDEFRLEDGRWVDLYSTPVTVGTDGRRARLWVVRDVSERKEYELDLERHRDRLDQFASMVSHDLRNPMNVAEGYLEVARERTDDEALAEVAWAHRRMRALIDDLLTLARTNRSITDLEPVCLATLVERCWRNVDADDAELCVETDRVVVADETRLSQVLENLLRNSVEHGSTSDQTGTDASAEALTITVGDLETGFYVEDDGVGIPPAQRQRVFESGYSTRPDGTGLGLDIVAQIVAAHGWEVELAEGTQGGVRFEITGVERPGL